LVGNFTSSAPGRSEISDLHFKQEGEWFLKSISLASIYWGNFFRSNGVFLSGVSNLHINKPIAQNGDEIEWAASKSIFTIKKDSSDHLQA
jgi:hypothetical protein